LNWIGESRRGRYPLEPPSRHLQRRL